MADWFSKIENLSEWYYVRIYPELERCEDAFIRKRALESAQHRLYTSAQVITAMCLLYSLVIISYVVLFTSTTVMSSPIYRYGIMAFGFLSAPLGSFVIPIRLFRQRGRRFLREELHKRGIPICVRCGYNLTGCLSDRCPECGGVIPRSSGE